MALNETPWCRLRTRDLATEAPPVTGDSTASTDRRTGAESVDSRLVLSYASDASQNANWLSGYESIEQSQESAPCVVRSEAP